MYLYVRPTSIVHGDASDTFCADDMAWDRSKLVTFDEGMICAESDTLFRFDVMRFSMAYNPPLTITQYALVEILRRSDYQMTLPCLFLME